jgi:hypothetical protein
MKIKQLYILCAVFGILLFAALIKKTLEVNQRMVTQRQEKIQAGLISGITPDFVSKIIIRKGDKEEGDIVLKKGSDGAWTVESRGGIKTKADAVQKFLKDILEIKGEVRGLSKTTFPDFQIADNEGLHVILQNAAGVDMTHLVFGLKMPRLGEGFVRLFGTEKVFVTNAAVSVTLGVYDADSQPSDRGFADFQLFSKELQERATRLEFFALGKSLFALTKAPDLKTGAADWRFDPPSRDQVDPAQADGYLKYLTEVEGRDLDDSAKAGVFGLDPAQMSVKIDVTTPGEPQAKTYELQRGSRVKDKNWMTYMRTLPADVVYHVPENAAQNMERLRTSFVLKKK